MSEPSGGVRQGGSVFDQIIEAVDVRKNYELGPALISVLRGVTLRVARGEVVGIVGESGVGKSTLLHLLGGLDRPTSGTVRIEESEVSSLDDRALSSLRSRRIGFVFQFHHLLPEFSALENVLLPRMIAGRTRREAETHARGLLADVGLADRLDHRPSQLSGGEQQRVAMARALVNDPAVVLADEPSGNLDRENGERLYELILRLRETRGQTFVIASHDPKITDRADRVLTLVEGTLGDGIESREVGQN